MDLQELQQLIEADGGTLSVYYYGYKHTWHAVYNSENKPYTIKVYGQPDLPTALALMAAKLAGRLPA